MSLEVNWNLGVMFLLDDEAASESSRGTLASKMGTEDVCKTF